MRPLDGYSDLCYVGERNCVFSKHLLFFPDLGKKIEIFQASYVIRCIAHQYKKHSWAQRGPNCNFSEGFGAQKVQLRRYVCEQSKDNL